MAKKDKVIYRNIFKPTIDRLVAFIIILILLPLFLIVYLSLKVIQRQAFYIQIRPGQDERLFKVVKFKTMNDSKDIHGNLLPDEMRLTNIGRIVRQTSIDELPQLWNVLRGDMSFVGPRPLLEEYLPLYSSKQRLRHKVKPGITGWAQVNGRNSLSWEKKFALDVWYVEHQSFGLDLKIIFLTILKVLKAEGISGEGSATMEKFKGSKID